MKAITLLTATNLAVMAVMYAMMHFLGIEQALQAEGYSSIPYLISALIYGFAGAFISLLLSKNMAKSAMGVRVIQTPKTATEQWLYHTVAQQAAKAGIKPPEIGIFNHHAPNAFATGHNKNAGLIAVSTGLLDTMRKEEVEAVIGHEMAHIYNGDMVASTLLQGVINSFVILLARIISIVITSAGKDNERRQDNTGLFIIIQLILQIFLGFLGSLLLMWHSRHREFHADRGGAELAGKHNMIAALRALERVQQQGAKDALPSELKAFGIVPLAGLLSTHPPLAKRIAALEKSDIRMR